MSEGFKKKFKKGMIPEFVCVSAFMRILKLAKTERVCLSPRPSKFQRP